MKPHAAEMHEGVDAFDRFRSAMKAILSVKKRDVVATPKPTRHKKRSNTAKS